MRSGLYLLPVEHRAEQVEQHCTERLEETQNINYTLRSTGDNETNGPLR